MPSPEASRRNLEKARAGWHHPPRPWRSAQETRVIKRLAWQWFRHSGQKCSARELARQLGVSHTYIQKLVQEFVRDPGKMPREERAFGPATFGHLCRAQEETRQQKERGWLRPPRRWKWAEFKIGDDVVRAVVPTKAEERRRAAGADPHKPRAQLSPYEVPIWATGMPVGPIVRPDGHLDYSALEAEAEERKRHRPVKFGGRWRPHGCF